MKKHSCYVCNDKGFCLEEGDVVPCPWCNPDSDVGRAAYLTQMLKSRGRCEHLPFACSLWNGHTGPHDPVPVCGR